MQYLKRTIIILIFGLSICAAIAYAGGGVSAHGKPVMVWAAITAFIINWLAFIPSSLKKTERFYDFTGAVANISVVIVAVLLSGNHSPRALIATAMVVIWAGRLGSFLFARINHDGGVDGRFDAIRGNPIRFFGAFTLQAVWNFLTTCCALFIIASGDARPIGAIGALGIALWIIGFSFEVIADRQKTAFKADPANAGKFINTGLWARAQHPNYFGEITLWIGMAVLALPLMSGWNYALLISPLFIVLLLTKISGINTLQARGDARWGEDPAYQAYRKNTPLLLPIGGKT